MVPDRPKSPAAIAIEAVHHGAPGDVVAIYKLIANGSFGPDEIEVMKAAYEAALAELDVSEQNSPITELIAKAILNVTLRGERDPKEIKERALHALGLRFSFDGRAAIPTFFGP